MPTISTTTSETDVKEKWRAFIVLAALIPAAIMLLIACSWTRYRADDFAIAVLTRNQGVIGATRSLWGDLGGRLSGYVTLIILVGLGPAMAPIVSASSLLMLCGLMTIFWRRSTSSWSAAAGAALAVVLSSALMVRTPVQNLYWVTGVGQITFGIITAFAVLLYAIYCSRHPSPSHWILLSVAGLVGFCFYEPINCYVIVSVVFVLLTTARKRLDGERRMAMLITGSSATFALAVMLLAPGTRARTSDVKPGVIFLVKHAIHLTGKFWLEVVSSPALYVLMLVGMLLPFRPAFSVRPRFIASAAALIACVVTFNVAATRYFGGFSMPVRTDYVHVMAIALLALVTGNQIGIRAAEYRIFPAGSLVLLGGCTIITAQALSYPLNAARWEAEEWQPRNSALDRAAPSDSVLTQRWRDRAGLDDITEDSTYWVNQAIAAFYNVNEVKARP